MKTKKNKGITLVALIVTIIILLILAGITIGQLVENGIFESAKTAKEQYENAQEEENVLLANYETGIDEYSRDTVTLTQENYNKLIDGITAKNINMNITTTYSDLWHKDAYAQGSTVFIDISMDCSIPKKSETVIGTIPSEYIPSTLSSDSSSDVGPCSAVYLIPSGANTPTVGVMYVNKNGEIIVGNWSNTDMNQVVGTLFYRYK